MNKFNVCKTYGQTLLRGTKNAIELPKNSFYGKDIQGLYYILNTKPFITDCGTIYLEIYRFKNNEWQLSYENSDTVNLIHDIATKNGLYNLPQSKCLHMYSVVQSRTRTQGSRHTKIRALKEISQKIAIKGTYYNIYTYQ